MSHTSLRPDDPCLDVLRSALSRARAAATAGAGTTTAAWVHATDTVVYEHRAGPETAAVLAQVRDFHHHDMVHEHVVGDLEWDSAESGTDAGSDDTPDDPALRTLGHDGPAVRRVADAAAYTTCVIAGGRGAGKTSLIAALTSGAAPVLQLLRCHQAHLANVWYDATPAAVAGFVAELDGGQRGFPFFPTELCVGTLSLDTAEVNFLRADASLAEAPLAGELLPAPDAPPLPPTATSTLQLVEVGGDLLAALHRGEPGGAVTRAVCDTVRRHLAASTVAVYFVNELECFGSARTLDAALADIALLCVEGTRQLLLYFARGGGADSARVVARLEGAADRWGEDGDAPLPHDAAEAFSETARRMLRAKAPRCAVTAFRASYVAPGGALDFRAMVATLRTVVLASPPAALVPARVAGQALHALLFRHGRTLATWRSCRRLLFPREHEHGGAEAGALFAAIEHLPPLAVLDHYADAVAHLRSVGAACAVTVTGGGRTRWYVAVAHDAVLSRAVHDALRLRQGAVEGGGRPLVPSLQSRAAVLQQALRAAEAAHPEWTVTVNAASSTVALRGPDPTTPMALVAAAADAALGSAATMP